jgi:hypothetical protein
MMEIRLSKKDVVVDPLRIVRKRFFGLHTNSLDVQTLSHQDTADSIGK